MSAAEFVTSARACSVAALLLAVSDALQARLGAVAVRGELAGFTRAASGHCYFTLKDADGQTASLRCAMFRRAAGLLDFRPADGQQVELRGRLTVYEARGELQCVVESMQPLGTGALYELYLKLRAKLEAEGLFDPQRKRPLPGHPRALGIVTSLGAAALHDVLTALARRSPHVQVVVYPTLVQGAHAPVQLAEAIGLANRRGEVDALIVCRGGGSLEDLWAFNDERVVRAVAASGLPVVCGVGHETDVTLAELAADLRAPTPTAAAELASPVRDDELQRLQALAQRLQRAARRRLDLQGQRLDRLGLQMGRPARRLAQQAAVLDRQAARLRQLMAQAIACRRQQLPLLAQRLVHALHGRQQHLQQGLDRLALRLAGAHPQRTLARGFSWLQDAHGRPVGHAAGLRAGDALRAHWLDGRADLTVQSVKLESRPTAIGADAVASATADAGRRPRRRAARPKPDPA